MSDAMMDLETPLDGQTAPQTDEQTDQRGKRAPQADHGRWWGDGDDRIEVPKNYWDARANDGRGAVNVGALIKSNNDLLGRIRNQPKAPDTYELVLPKDLEDRIEINAEDPRIAKLNEIARARNLNQDTYNDLIALGLGHDAADAQAEAQWSADQKAALHKLYGAELDSRLRALGEWGGAYFSRELQDPDMAEELHALTHSAGGVKLLSAVRERLDETPLPDGRDAGTPALTDAQINTVMASAAYLDSTHQDYKATQEQVSDYFRRKYPPKN